MKPNVSCAVIIFLSTAFILSVVAASLLVRSLVCRLLGLVVYSPEVFGCFMVLMLVCASFLIVWLLCPPEQEDVCDDSHGEDLP